MASTRARQRAADLLEALVTALRDPEAGPLVSAAVTSLVSAAPDAAASSLQTATERLREVRRGR